MNFVDTPKTYPRVAHYQWCADHEGKRALLAIRKHDADRAYFHARDAAHWAMRVLDEKEK